ncbi:hypothetical protein FRB96_005319 [Tulasnella sp. 330]|nr:hypothetical protein FRB96_005319 [Tulasnella sp. 330]
MRLRTLLANAYTILLLLDGVVAPPVPRTLPYHRKRATTTHDVAPNPPHRQSKRFINIGQLFSMGGKLTKVFAKDGAAAEKGGMAAKAMSKENKGIGEVTQVTRREPLEPDGPPHVDRTNDGTTQITKITRNKDDGSTTIHQTTQNPNTGVSTYTKIDRNNEGTTTGSYSLETDKTTGERSEAVGVHDQDGNLVGIQHDGAVSKAGYDAANHMDKHLPEGKSADSLSGSGGGGGSKGGSADTVDPAKPPAKKGIIALAKQHAGLIMNIAMVAPMLIPVAEWGAKKLGLTHGNSTESGDNSDGDSEGSSGNGTNTPVTVPINSLVPNPGAAAPPEAPGP